MKSKEILIMTCEICVYTAPKTAAARSQTALLPLENRSSIMLVAHGSVTTNIRRSWYDRLSGNIAAS